MEKVSIIIPVYKAEEYIALTVQSVLDQTYDNFEILIIDDGSPDRSVEICKQFTDPRIQIISQKNQGVSAARNKGIQIAQGEFIAFLDADDLWFINKLAAHVRHLSINPNLGMSFARVEFMNFDGQRTGQISNPPLRNITSKKFYEENLAVTPSNAVIRKVALEQVGGFEKDLSGFEDVELFLRIVCHGWQVEGINQVLTVYRTSNHGISAQLYKMEEEWNLLNQKIEVYAPKLVKLNYNYAKAILLRYLARRTLRLNSPPSVGINFINRALCSEWRIIFREPRRTISTIAGVYLKRIIPSLNFS
jgi:glycosyltransferase involved in cell wall biosynthesis